jgi:hypothetical protein
MTALALRYWWAIAIAGLIALLALQTGRLDSAKASLHTSRAETARERATSRAWEASFRQSEGMRLKDQDAASAASKEADAKCDARVSAARKSSHAILTITQKVPTYDQAGCPTRERVPDGLLLDALKPAG